MNAKGQGDPGEDHASRVGAESPCSDMKRAVAKKLIERYFYQLIDGCGSPDCDNPNCASSGKVTNLTPNQAAAQAIQLFSQEARLCDGTQPSKVARTLAPGPASLAKCVPVKNFNPTCSDEAIASNSGTTPAPLGNDLIMAIPINVDDRDVIRVANVSDLTPVVLMNKDVDNSTGRQTEANGIEICPNLVAHTESCVPSCSSQRKETTDNNSYHSLPSADVNSRSHTSTKSVNPSKMTFRKIWTTHKIPSPQLNKKAVNAERNSRRDKAKITSSRHGVLKKVRSFMNIAKTNRKSTSKRNVMSIYCPPHLLKLLFLALYLRQLKQDRYTKRHVARK